MESNVIALNRTRPESWTILIRQNHGSFISCVFDEKSQVWAGWVEAATIGQLAELLKRAKGAMQTAKAQNREVRIWG